jgi:hypothetical protein
VVHLHAPDGYAQQDNGDLSDLRVKHLQQRDGLRGWQVVSGSGPGLKHGEVLDRDEATAGAVVVEERIDEEHIGPVGELLLEREHVARLADLHIVREPRVPPQPRCEVPAHAVIAGQEIAEPYDEYWLHG